MTTTTSTSTTATTGSESGADESSAAPESTGTQPTACNNDNFEDEGEECDRGAENIPPDQVGDQHDVCTTECKRKNYCHDKEIQPLFEQCDCGAEPCKAGNGAECVACQYGARYVFVTSAPVTLPLTLGKLTGLEAAHALCTLSAQQSKQFPEALSDRVFKAWLSDGDAAPVDWLSELDLGDEFPDPQPYVLVDGTLVAESFSLLASTGPSNTITLDEEGHDTVGSVWTNVMSTGKALTPLEDCDDWSSNSKDDVGRIGINNKIDEWTEGKTPGWLTQSCSVTFAHLYCFEQTPLQKSNEKFKATQ